MQMFMTRIHDVLRDTSQGAIGAVCNLFRKVCAWKLPKIAQGICVPLSCVIPA